MNKDKKLIPELRFPEFKSDGEWEEIKLKQSATFYRGLTYGQEDIADNGLLVLRSGNIQNDTLVLIKDLVHVQKDCPDDLKLMNGDVVICMSNGSKSLVGKNAEYRGEYSGNITVGAFCSIMRPKNRFTKYLLQSDSYQTFIALSIGGGNINNLKNSDLEEFECAVPKKNLEQQKIASCLSSLDEVITAHSQKLELLKDHKKGLMQNLFPQEGEKVPKYRFKEFEKGGEWELKPFSKYIKLYRGSSPRPIIEYQTQGEDGVNWIKIGDTGSVTDFVIRSVSEKITPKGAEKSRAVKKGELILANSMSYGSTYLLDIEGCIYDGWFVLREYDEVFEKQFLLQLLNSEYMQNQYKKLAAGGIVQNISSEIVYSTLLPKTSKPEQQKIASCLSSLDALIVAQAEKIEQLNLHKKGLMQGLFPKIND